MAEQLFASFILDREQGLEIAIAAENVTEATPIIDSIQPLPASVSFLEGIMHLRDDVIPVLNLKKRLGLGKSDYDKDAKIAVIKLENQRFGLLFDDIREVLRVDDSLLLPIQPALQSEDAIISGLITLPKQHRTLEVLDLKRLFPGSDLQNQQAVAFDSQEQPSQTRTYSRYVIFSSGSREYGIPVENSRELTFLSDIDDMFKTDYLEGALQLRGRTIPVMSAGALLNGGSSAEEYGELNRILVMSMDSLSFGMIIDEIVEILTVVNEEILPMPAKEEQSVTGIYEPTPDRNIMLLNVENLVASQMELLKSMARIKTDSEEEKEDAVLSEARHLITENCYLIFSIGKYFAIELKDVQEIIERNTLMQLPAAIGFDSTVLNLRGQVVPVVDLRKFYDFPDQKEESDNSRLIICRDGNSVIALQVDSIVTIYKQEQFFATPSLSPQLQPRKDTLDRLIEFLDEKGIKKHLLVVNTHNLINNHLRQGATSTEHSVESQESEQETSQLTDPEKRSKT